VKQRAPILRDCRDPLDPVPGLGLLKATGSDSPDEQCHENCPGEDDDTAAAMTSAFMTSSFMTSSVGHSIDPFGS
jgi:hypothetical protein